jgi:hypothetical protein
MQQTQGTARTRGTVLVASLVILTAAAGIRSAAAATLPPEQLDISAIKASAVDGTNVAANAIDENLTTRWSGYGSGVTLTSTLATAATVQSVDIAWYRGDTRKNTFVLAASTDGTTWKTVYSGTSSGTTANGESYDTADTSAKYIRITVNGNTENLWASISELKVYGAYGTTTTTTSAMFTDTFTGSDGLITNEYAYWNPTKTGIRTSPNWEMTSGSLFRKNNMAWTGIPDGTGPGISSSTYNDSAVFRLTTKRSDFGNVAVTFDLLNKGLVTTSRTSAESYDGVHVWTRHQSEYSMYYASINRRDSTIVIKKKVPGGPSNGGTYYTLKSGKFSVPYGSWQKIKVTTKTNSDGSVTVAMYNNGSLLLSATDTGIGGSPIRTAGATGIRGDNCQFYFDNFTVSKL